MNSSPRPLRRRRTRGQAMVEYSWINVFLIMALCLTSTARVFPGKKPTDPQKNVIELFLDAYQVYYDSYYFVLNLPFP
ncbi:MAG: hypothetical protein IPJ65_07010 [Archangiaceae bacterium]|nr:hypothetical protein [Archangiaceae bacterium]